jgi:ElaB/YqjD/DUF883 family membrane-anchored ribosome-binding protein
MANDNYSTGLSQTGESLKDEAKDAASGVISKVQDKAREVGDKARDLGRNAVSAIDAKREPLANGLSNAAGSLHSTGDKASQFAQDAAGKVSELAHGAAEKLQSGAEYVRDHDLNDMVSSVNRFVKKNPGVALLAAGVVGFVAARALRND